MLSTGPELVAVAADLLTKCNTFYNNSIIHAVLNKFHYGHYGNIKNSNVAFKLWHKQTTTTIWSNIWSTDTELCHLQIGNFALFERGMSIKMPSHKYVNCMTVFWYICTNVQRLSVCMSVICLTVCQFLIPYTLPYIW